MTTIVYLFGCALFVACIVTFLLLLAYKWGFVEHLQVHGNAFLSKMAGCDFCMSFWASVLVMFFAIFFVDEPWMLTVPLFSTPLTRMMV